MGRSEDVRFENADRDEIVFVIKGAKGETTLSASTVAGADTLPLVCVGDLENLMSEVDNYFQYLQADRITPATQYDQASTPQQQRGWLGCRGEYAVDFLLRNQDRKISPGRLFPREHPLLSEALLSQVAPTDSLLDQTSGWLQHLSPGVRPRPAAVDLADLTSLRYSYTGTSVDSASRDRRPSNVGFGVTYSLPIIVACLSAPAGDLLLPENPEAHLHPRGQSALGNLLALCAADGVQIIVETHSDHLVNGIRVAAKRSEISSDAIAVHFFSRDVETGESSITSPVLHANGRFSDWPEGFFDEWSRALDELLETTEAEPMTTPVLFLDEASRHAGAVERPQAEATAKTLIDTLRGIRKFKHKFALNTERALGHYRIAENWTLQSILGGTAFKEEWAFIRDLANRSPLSAGVEHLLLKVEDTDFRTRPAGVPSVALAWATLLDSGVVSFKAHADWSRSWVETTYLALEDDETITEDEGRVRNASLPEHAEEHAGWLRSLGLEELPTGSQAWSEREQRFPGLRFLASVEKDLLSLWGSGAPYAQALSLLEGLSADAVNWPEGQQQPTFSTKVTPEHVMRRKLCWWHDEATGEKELFDTHARFTGSFAGRIHFRLDVPNHRIVIAYVGGKLD